jgi:ABC-type uncharacterized transport system substrate-binding protein
MIVAVTDLGAKAAKQATSTIPIVVVAHSDPLGGGLVESLARPGGNVTGLSVMAVDLSGKLFTSVVSRPRHRAGNFRHGAASSTGTAW